MLMFLIFTAVGGVNNQLTVNPQSPASPGPSGLLSCQRDPRPRWALGPAVALSPLPILLESQSLQLPHSLRAESSPSTPHREEKLPSGTASFSYKLLCAHRQPFSLSCQATGGAVLPSEARPSRELCIPPHPPQCLVLFPLMQLQSLPSFKTPAVRAQPSSVMMPSTWRCSVAQLCLTLVTPRTIARQASGSITNSRSLLTLMSTESLMPSNHLILCCSLLLLP